MAKKSRIEVIEAWQKVINEHPCWESEKEDKTIEREQVKQQPPDE